MKNPRAPFSAEHAPKRKLNQNAGNVDDDYKRVPKPGLRSPVAHIAMLPSHRDVAVELTRGLKTNLAERLGVRRRWPY